MVSQAALLALMVGQAISCDLSYPGFGRTFSAEGGDATDNLYECFLQNVFCIITTNPSVDENLSMG